MRLHLGYRNAPSQPQLRGHEFHYSEVRPVDGGENAVSEFYNAKGAKTNTPLYRHKNLLAGYTHLYWGETNIFHTLFKDLP
jgi:cobyrinic acid a,c-diamide synthase